MTASKPNTGDRVIIYTEGCLPCPATVTEVADGVITKVRAGGSWLTSGVVEISSGYAPPSASEGWIVLWAGGSWLTSGVVEISSGYAPPSASEGWIVLWDMGDPDPGAVPLDERVALLRRVGDILRGGGWSMGLYGGRDCKRWIDTALDGDAAALTELGEDLRAIEED